MNYKHFTFSYSKLFLTEKVIHFKIKYIFGSSKNFKVQF